MRHNVIVIYSKGKKSLQINGSYSFRHLNVTLIQGRTIIGTL